MSRWPRSSVVPTVLGAMLLAVASCAADPMRDGTGVTAPLANSAPTPPTGTAGTAGTARTAPSSTAAGGTTLAPFVPTALSWERCGPAVQCATLIVPRDYADPAGPRLALAVARRPARDPDRRIGSLLFNPGGPGASGVEFVKASATLDDLNGRFDIVSWDPRGVGQSAPVRCGTTEPAYQALDWSPDTDGERRQLDEGAHAVAQECAAADPELLAHLSTDDSARDLESIRRAVGDERLSYVGFSYGTFIGLRYADLFPDRVRAIVLDGVVDPTEDLAASLAGQTRALEQQTREVFDRCDHSTSCPVRDAGATYDRLAATVERRPLPAGSRQLGPTALAYAVIGSAYSAAASDELLAGLAAADGGDGRALLALADGYFDTSSFGSYLATLCVDSPHPVGSAAYSELERHLQQLSPRFGAAVANEVRPCAFWAAPVASLPAAVHAVGSVPILVVGNRGDFATPYESAARVAGQLDHGVLLTYDGQGHLSYGKSPCVDAQVDAYLTDLTIPAEGATC